MKLYRFFIQNMISFLLLSLSFASRQKNDKSKSSYYECASFVRHIESDVKSGVAKDQLKKKSQQYCSNIPDKVRQDFCSTLLQDDQFDKIYDFAKNQNVDSICSKLGYSRSFGRGRVITEDQCVSIIDSLKEEMKKNNEASSEETEKLDSKHNIKQQLNKKRPNSAKFSHSNVCKKFADGDKVTCQMISRVAYRTVLDDLLANAESLQICYRLQDLRKIQLAKDET